MIKYPLTIEKKNDSILSTEYVITNCEKEVIASVKTLQPDIMTDIVEKANKEYSVQRIEVPVSNKPSEVKQIVITLK